MRGEGATYLLAEDVSEADGDTGARGADGVTQRHATTVHVQTVHGNAQNLTSKDTTQQSTLGTCCGVRTRKDKVYLGVGKGNDREGLVDFPVVDILRLYASVLECLGDGKRGTASRIKHA